MSVPVLLLLLGTLALLVWLIVKLIRAPRKLGEAAAQYRGRRAGKRFTQGLIEIAEGNYAKGERMLTRGASYADAPLMNYLAAARAAQLQNEDETRIRKTAGGQQCDPADAGRIADCARAVRARAGHAEATG